MLSIVSLPGDGIGPEVLKAAEKVFLALEKKHGRMATWTTYPCGGKYWLETSQEWSAEAQDAAQKADAVLLGAVGWPGATKPDGEVAGGGVLFGLRLGQDLYANVRPCRLYPGVLHRVHDSYQAVWQPEKVDMVLVRENTEGAYTPIKGYLDRGGSQELAVDSRVITRKGAERVIRFSFELARKRKTEGRGPGRVTGVDKSNVLAGCRLFRKVFHEVAKDYPEIETSNFYIDAFCHALIRTPEAFDVVVLPNLQGDVATDLAAVLQGGMGMAASGNIGDGHAMFEPVHGSAPDLAGKGLANPLATIHSLEMALEYLGERHPETAFPKARADLEAALEAYYQAGEHFPQDLGGEAGLDEVTEALLSHL